MTLRKTPIAKTISKKFADEKYRLACSQPFLWICKAREVRRAADLIWKQFQSELSAYSLGSDSTEPFTGSVALMLYGLTIENLSKAGLVEKDGAHLSNRSFGIKSHDLEKLANELGLSLTAEDRELLERLEGFVKWAGRYPIPLYADDLRPRAMTDGSKAVLYGLSSDDLLAINALIERIESIIPSEEAALERYVKEYRS